jgi:multidrug efflux pump subunit AcrB
MKEDYSQKLKNQMQSFSAFLIRNTKVAFLLGLAITVMGLFATSSITKESAPTIEYGVAVISTAYPGVSATDIDSLITEKIESKISSITSIKKYESTSQNGFSSISLEFRPGVDMVKAISDVRSKVDEAKGELPTDLDSDPKITEIDSSLQPFLQVILYGKQSPAEISTVAEKLKRKVESLSGVASVSLSGNNDTQIIVDIDKRKLEALQLSLPQVQSAIRNAHSDVPIGELEINDLEYSLRFQGKLKNLEDVKNVVITNLSGSSANTIIRVKDIAKITETGAETSSIFRYAQNGEPSQTAVKLNISRSSGGDIFGADRRVKELMEKFSEEEFLPEMNYAYAAEGAEIMREDFSELLRNASTSVAVVMLLIFFFIGLREGFIAAIVIPLTFLATIFALFFMGKSLNFMTNFSMILALGILVDTAIVMVEGAHNFVKRGYAPKQAALLSFLEFRAPLVSGMTTTVVVFLPLFFLPDIMGKYLAYIPITVSLVLTFALFISLFLIPSYAGMLLKVSNSELDNNPPIPPSQGGTASPCEGGEGELRSKRGCPGALRGLDKKCGLLSSMREKIDSLFEKYIEQYRKLLLVLVKTRLRRWIIFGVTFLLFFGSFLLPTKFEMFPTADSPSLTITLEKEVGTIETKTLDEIIKIENLVLSYPEVEKITTSINGYTGSVYVEFFPQKEREDKGLKTSKELEFEWGDTIKTLTKDKVQIKVAAQGPPSQSPVGFRVIAGDIENLNQAQEVTKALTKLVEKTPGTQGVSNTITQIPGEFRFIIDREKALKLGVPPESIAGIVRTAIYGSTVATISRGTQDIDIRVQFESDEIVSIEDVKKIMITPSIPLSDLVSISKKSALSQINRYDGKLMFRVSSFLTKDGNTQEVTAAVMKQISDGNSATSARAGISLPEGVTIEDASENAENAALFNALIGAGIMAILMIFIILVVQFNSFSQPLLILQTILFAQIGVALGLFLTDTPRSLAYILGVISLAGIVVNDAIIMVDKMNKNLKSEEFTSRFEAIAAAGSARFIPVILTTLTTSAGIIPLIFVDAFWAGLSYTIVFGLMVSTIMTLFLIPVGYTLFWNSLGKNVDTSSKK